MYQRSMSETILDSNRQPMFVWEQAGSADAANAKFHVLGRSYGHTTLSDLSAALAAILVEIDNYRSDMAEGMIDRHGVETEKGRVAKLLRGSEPTRETMQRSAHPGDLTAPCYQCRAETDHMQLPNQKRQCVRCRHITDEPKEIA